MPQFLLGIAFVLLFAPCGSLIGFSLNRRNGHEGKIQLSNRESEYLTDRDPLDVTEPIDFVDGIPIGEEAFWNKASKIFLSPRQDTRLMIRC
jgi:hypothetical protein